MADDKRGREKQAADAERRQRERALDEALERADEAEPPAAETADDETEPSADETTDDEPTPVDEECHRRGCSEPAAFVVRERYLEETGHGAVVAEAYLCREHTAEEGPTNLDSSYPEYVFCVESITDIETESDA